VPLYEYKCSSCGATSERLVRPHESTVPTCRECGSDRVVRLLSNFALDSDAIRESSVAKGKAKKALETRDKTIALFEDAERHRH